MKYLKKFNENNSYNKLRNIVENHLVDLLDDDVILELEGFDGGYTVALNRFKNGFLWEDINDYFIPFLIYINEYYDIVDESNINPNVTEHLAIRFGFSNGLDNRWVPAEFYSIEDIIEDKVNKKDKIVTITFNVIEK